MITNIDDFRINAPVVALAYVSTVTSKHYIKTDFSKSLSSIVDVQEPKSGNQKDCIQRVFDKYRIAINEYLKDGKGVHSQEFVDLRALFDVAHTIWNSGDIHLMDKGHVLLQYMHNNGYMIKKPHQDDKNKQSKRNIEDNMI